MAKLKAEDRDKNLRRHLLYLLRGGGAHLHFDDAIAGIPPRLRGMRPAELPHTIWRLLEHMRLAQWDILDFCRNPEYKLMNFPEDYWPGTDAPPSVAAWNRSVAGFRSDLEQMQRLVSNRGTDLFAPIPHGDGQTILREALLVADHNAYHLGEIVTLRRLLGIWGK
jgi:hypothetical protein